AFPQPPRGWFERLAAALVALVMICRLLTPTEGAAGGETLWIAQLTLLVFLVWVFAAYRQGGLTLDVGWFDMAVACLCLGHIAGALVVIASEGDKRAALNMLWEWCGLGVTFFLMRQILASPAVRTGLLTAVAVTAIPLAGLGLWQHDVSYAQTRREYEKLKAEQQALELAGRPFNPSAAVEWERALQRLRAELVRNDIPVDQAARVLWEQRLYSSEPNGLFALANTLAGFLACASIVWLAALVYAAGRVARWQVAIGAVLAIVILYCLLLTKSRTAFVGLAAGLASWGIAVFRRRARSTRRPWWALAYGLAAVIGVVMIAGLTGGLDRFVISESGKSLRYRAQYWTGTWRMLVSSPRNALVGVGPGNFRQNYLPFKLAESSEEIADPHNLMLDAWANGGLVGLLGLVSVCAAGLRPLLTRSDGNLLEAPVDRSVRLTMLAGGGLAHPAVFFAGAANGETTLLLSTGWLSAAATCKRLFEREFPPVVFAAAFAALAVHLLGAGGIGMPAISQLLLFLVILGRRSDDGSQWKFESSSRWPIAGLGVAGLTLYFGCWFTGLNPDIAARNAIAAGKQDLFEQGSPAKAEREFRRAANADPYSPEPYRLLSQLAFQRWLASDVRQMNEFKRSAAWQREAVARNPRFTEEYRALGHLYLAKLSHTGAVEDAAAAAQAFERAVALYPNSAAAQSELAEALWKVGRMNEARLAADRACELDAINEAAGHIDKRLPVARRELMNRISGRR
ncbi:MAG TPA: O-antigen ligase family protein, partial [Planctomycetaceae bacterium]|nr:O-antigen ligase family protein [Planctomycetaceae bacterium]